MIERPETPVNLNAIRDRVRSERPDIQTGKNPEQILDDQIIVRKVMFASAIGSQIAQANEYSRFATLPRGDQEQELARMNRVFTEDDKKISPEAYLATLKPDILYEVRIVNLTKELTRLIFEREEKKGLSEKNALEQARVEIDSIVPIHQESAPQEFPTRVNAYQKIAEMLHLRSGEGQVVYHPCGGIDISPSSAFPNAKVYYADIDGRAMHTLARRGYDAFLASATSEPVVVEDEEIPSLRLPETPTILILVNQSISPEHPASLLAPGGIAIVNNYHKTASQLNERDDMEFIGMVRYDDIEKGLDVRSFDTSITSNPEKTQDHFFVFRKKAQNF